MVELVNFNIEREREGRRSIFPNIICPVIKDKEHFIMLTFNTKTILTLHKVLSRLYRNTMEGILDCLLH